MDCYPRLQEERLRLGLSLKDAAKVADTTLRTMRRWESEQKMPIAALSALAKYGYDAQYVCTGRRSMNNKGPLGKGGTEEDTPYVPAYAPDEVEWILRLRQLDPDQRRQLQAVLDALAPKPRRAKRARRTPVQDAEPPPASLPAEPT